MTSMDDLSSDYLLNIVRYLSVKDANALATTSKRLYYIVHHYRLLRGPELVAATSHIPQVRTRSLDNKQLVQQAVDQIQAPPNLVLAFNTYTNATLVEDLPALVPDNAVILGAVTPQIQSSFKGVTECKSKAALFLGSLSNACVKPFMFDNDESVFAGAAGENRDNNGLNPESFGLFTSDLAAQANSDCSYWKVFIVYATNTAVQIDTFIDTLQAAYPDATIVGGIVAEGYVSVPVSTNVMTKEKLKQCASIDLLQLNKSLGGGPPPTGIDKRQLVEHVYALAQSKQYLLETVGDTCIFGIALGGQDVPFRSMVSRGVHSLTQQGAGTKLRPSTCFTIVDADYHTPTDPSYVFRGEDPPPYHLIRQIRDTDTDKLYSSTEFVTAFGEASFIGLRRPGEDGFELHQPHPVSMNLNSFLILGNDTEATAATYLNANIDLLELDGQACMQDLDHAVHKLREQTAGQQILGAVMVSCSGRGPTADGLIPEEMSDATRFAKVFPEVPCLGFYAGGEIGPKALAGRESAFFNGSVSVQGFTAVFALFIVPIVDLSGMDLDDCQENVDLFVASRFGNPE